MADITLTIDNVSVTVPAGTTILKAAEKLGQRVPTICYHEHCTANGLCRICVVEVEGVKPLLPACLSQVSEAMKVSTSSARVVLFSNCLTPPWIYLKRRRFKSSSRIIAPTARAFRKPKGVRLRCSMITRCTSATMPSAFCAGVAFRCAPTTRSSPTRLTSRDAASTPASAPSSTSPCRKRAAYFAASAWVFALPAR